MTNVTVYHDCGELTREQFEAMFGDNSDANVLYQLIRGSQIFGHRNGGRLIRGTANTRVYTVVQLVLVSASNLRYNSWNDSL